MKCESAEEPICGLHWQPDVDGVSDRWPSLGQDGIDDVAADVG